MVSQLIARAYLVRGAITWIGARGLISMAMLLGQGDPSRLAVPAVMQVVGLAVVLGMVDVRRRHEDMFLANLGVGRGVLAALFAIPAIAGEVVIAIAFRSVQ